MRFGFCLAAAKAAAETSETAIFRLGVILVSKAECKPVLVSQFNVIALESFLIGSLVRESDSLERAGFHTGLFASGTAFLVPVGRINTEIAFGGFVYILIPDCPMIRLLRTIFEAHLASDAFIAVDPPDIAVGRIYICSSDGAIRNAGRIHALQARRHFEVIRKIAEGILADLDARKRQVLLSIVHE